MAWMTFKIRDDQPAPDGNPYWFFQSFRTEDVAKIAHHPDGQVFVTLASGGGFSVEPADVPGLLGALGISPVDPRA